jgi:hypothetical protein
MALGYLSGFTGVVVLYGINSFANVLANCMLLPLPPCITHFIAGDGPRNSIPF